MDILSKQEIQNSLSKNYKKFDIRIFDTITSTNDFAKELINSNNFQHGTTIIANSQTKGRGRFGKTFFSPADTGIYLSTIFKVSLKLQDLSLITIISAIAVCKTITNLSNLKPKIKWINDVCLNKKKFCGILVENINNINNIESKAIVVGIGINMMTNIFPEEIKDKAASIMLKTVSRNIFIAKLINNLYDLLKNVYDKKVIEEYKKLSLVLGKEISYIKNNTEYFVTAVNVNEYGNLVVRDKNNNISILDCSEISIKL